MFYRIAYPLFQRVEGFAPFNRIFLADFHVFFQRIGQKSSAAHMAGKQTLFLDYEFCKK